MTYIRIEKKLVSKSKRRDQLEDLGIEGTKTGRMRSTYFKILSHDPF